ncbi:MAG: trehalose utilization protein [Yoonia sp.]|jgi:trehalose utilization protein
MLGAIVASLGIEATTATLQEPEYGLADDRLADADVLLWWGHAAHFAKIFKRLMGTPCGNPPKN